MRTTPYKTVFDKVVRQLGRNPRKDIDDDMRDAIVDHINERVRVICQIWPWTQWQLTEERAFRQVWNDSHQYLRANFIDGQPDEVFYIPDLTYYRVNVNAASDPPVGTIPTASGTFFSVIDPVDTFIAYDQVCKRSIGMVLGVYTRNPRVPTGSNCGGLRFMPSERGIDVLNPGNPTVFIKYKMPVPKYTMIPYVVGRNYAKGAIVLDPNVGEVFQALAPNSSVPSDQSFWRRVPFPEEWEGYVKQGAFADCMSEFDQGGNADLQAKIALAQIASDKADTLLQVEVDALAIQGQKLRWNICQQIGTCCESQPWTGGDVTELTDQCEDELGWIYPTPVDTPMVTWRFYNEITSVSGPTNSLVAIATRLLLPGSIAEFVIGLPGSRERHTWQLLSGGGDISDPAQLHPLDYDAVTNNKHWEKISG